MAKIVPKGYADIGAYNEGDDFFQLLEYIDKFGANYKDITKRNDENLSGAFDSILNAVNSGAIDSETEYNKFYGEYSALMEQVDKSTNPGIKLAYETLGTLMESEQGSIKIFESGFESISQQMTNTTDLLHRESEIWSQDYISNLSVDDLMKEVTKFDTMAAKLGYDPKSGKIAKYTGYTKNGVNISQVENHLKFGQNRLKNVEEALRNKMSTEEWNYIRSNPDNTEFDTVREDVKQNSLQLYKDATTEHRNLNKLLNLFQERKSGSIIDTINYGMAHGVSGSQEMGEFAFEMTGDVSLYNEFVAQNPESISSGAAGIKSKKERIKELKAKQKAKIATQEELIELQNNPLTPTEEKILVFASMYDDMMESVHQKKDKQTILREQMLEKYNFWSEVPMDIDVAEPNIPKEKVIYDAEPPGLIDEEKEELERLRKEAEERARKEAAAEDKVEDEVGDEGVGGVIPKEVTLAEQYKNNKVIEHIGSKFPPNVIDVVVGNSESSTLDALLTSIGANSTMALMHDALKYMTGDTVKSSTKKSSDKKVKKEEKLSMSFDAFAKSINSSWDAKRYAGGFQANALSTAARNYKNNPNATTKKKLEYFYNKYAK